MCIINTKFVFYIAKWYQTKFKC